MKYSAVLIDDESKVREVLSIKLGQHMPDIEVVGKAATADEGKALIAELDPDLVFLDISMPGKTGFEMIAEIEDVGFEIIFVTGYDEYGIDALKVSAVDYLLKPVKTADLIAAVGKAIDRIEQRKAVTNYENLVFNLGHLGDQKSRLAVPGTDAYEFVNIADIIRCEGWQKYTKIYLANGQSLVSSYNLGVFKEMLANYDFYLTHKSHLINVSHITRYMRDGEVIMSDDSAVPVSRRKKDEFINDIVKANQI